MSDPHINAVLNQIRGAFPLGETRPDHNRITVWYNQHVDHTAGDAKWCEMSQTWAMWTAGAKSIKKGRAWTVLAARDGYNKVNGSSWH